MVTILKIILGLFAVSFGILFLPLIAGGFFAWTNFNDGNIGGAILALVLGIICQWLFFLFLTNGEGLGGGNDCPYCGDSDTDGNHCYGCDEDF